MFAAVYLLTTRNTDILRAGGIIPSIAGQKRPATAEPDMDEIKQEDDTNKSAEDQIVFPDRIKALEVDFRLFRSPRTV